MDDCPITATILGSCSGIPVPGRFHASVALRAGADLYLLDAGEPAASSLVARGVGPDDLAASFISHMHADHCAGLPMLVQWMQLAGRKRPLRVYLPAPALDPARRHLDSIFLGAPFLPFPLELSPVTPGIVLSDGSISVEAHPTTHLAPYARAVRKGGLDGAALCLESYLYVVTAGRKRIVYSGDLGSPADLDPVIDGADLLIVELAHFPPEDLFRYLGAKSVARVVCFHLHPDLETRLDELAATARRFLQDRASIAFDGMEVRL
ncbi:MAG: MBL fold metallo-hydrolase [Planctomycetota bacterium]